MTGIRLICQGAAARAEVSGVITAGTVGMPVHIECDESWDGLLKTFVAMTAAGRKATAITENTATVPWEILIEGMRLFIGLEGRNTAGDTVIPTVWADCGRIKPSTEGSHQGKPTPSEIEQLLTVAGEAKQRSQDAEETAAEARETAADALEKAQLAWGATGDPEALATLLGGKQDTIEDTGLLKGAGDGTVTAAVPGEDYQAPMSAGDVSSRVTVALLYSGWSGGAQTVNAAGVTATNNVIVTPHAGSRDAYINADVRCTAQGAGTLTFEAATTPTVNILVNVLVIKL